MFSFSSLYASTPYIHNICLMGMNLVKEFYKSKVPGLRKGWSCWKGSCSAPQEGHLTHKFLFSLMEKRGSLEIDKDFYGLPWWLRGKESTCQCTRLRFDPSVGKVPWRRKWQPTLAFLAGEFHGQRSLVGYNPRGRKSWTRLNSYSLQSGRVLVSYLRMHVMSFH